MVMGQLQYEEIRKLRLEENKKKLEDLNLTHLLHTLRNATTIRVKQGKPRAIRKNEGSVEVRRSSRVVKMLDPHYKRAANPLNAAKSHVDDGESTWRTRRYERRCLVQRVYALDKRRSDAVKKANKVQSKLDPEFPSFVKSMLKSHVSRASWLWLPRRFCELYLPKDDATITLIDENGEEHQMRYLAHTIGLSAGWLRFTTAQGLGVGDALVFQLITATKFKVYIIRASGSST